MTRGSVGGTFLAALAIGLGACGGDEEPVARDSPATSATGTGTPTAGTAPTPGAAGAECLDLDHQGRRLGLTVPAGFDVEIPPEGAAEGAETFRVNALAWAELPPAGGDPLPSAGVAAYAYGEGDRSGQSALEASVLNFKDRVGGSSGGDPITATPTTVAGQQGAAGGGRDSRALDYNDPDDQDTPLRWWTLNVGDVEFVVTLASRTAELDARYATLIAGGLRPGGCG